MTFKEELTASARQAFEQNAELLSEVKLTQPATGKLDPVTKVRTGGTAEQSNTAQALAEHFELNQTNVEVKAFDRKVTLIRADYPDIDRLSKSLVLTIDGVEHDILNAKDTFDVIWELQGRAAK